MSAWEKLDPTLATTYARYLHGEQRIGSNVVNVVVQFRGDLDELRALGFQRLVATEPARASGSFDLADLERIAEHPGIVKLSVGRKLHPKLDKSIPDIEARPGAWDFTAGHFTGTTGDNIIVAVIDTGIDWQHPFFREIDPPNNPRILAIWDMGLTPQLGSGEASPPLSRLHNGSTAYGVEYLKKAITDALAAPEPAKVVRTRDCDGHGTHVASIAAGNGRPDFKCIGVAPKADIIAVKLLYLEKEPPVSDIEQFQDAVMYVLNTVKEIFSDRPVVFNVSLGTDIGPHDGFTDEEDWLTETFAGKPGKAMAMSAGNDAGIAEVDIGLRKVEGVQHVEIKFDAAGSATLPIVLYDGRTKTVTGEKCVEDDLTSDLELDLYYADGSPAITCSFDAPDDAVGFIAGPALNGAPVPVRLRNWTHMMTHTSDNQQMPRGHPPVHRNVFKIDFKINNEKKHWTGEYQFKVQAAGAVTAHLWVHQGDGYGLFIESANLPAEVVDDSWNSSLIGPDAGSASVITVAAYNAESAGHETAVFSSRGPLVRYDNSAGIPPSPPKPDIAAPGLAIDAAQGRDSEGAKKKYKRTAQLQGTSMASPHVAGAAALLLEKKKTLTGQDLAQILKANVHTDRPTNTPNETGAGQIDVKNAINNIP